MRRREFIAFAGASVAWPFAAMAQQAGRTYRLGCLSPFTRDVPFNVLFFDKIRLRGFIEGQNLTIDFRAFAPRLDLLSQYAAELVTTQPDVIYAGGCVAARAVRQATKSIPVVTIADDIVGEGLWNRSPGPMEIQRASASSRPSLTANDRTF
jgi:putative ABC transport system substrate-binding protein